MALKTNYKDDVFEGNRKYTLTQGGDGKYEIIDSTNYTVQGDTFGANDINATNTAINAINDVKEVWMRVADFTSTTPYTAQINVPGMKSTDTPLISHALVNGATDSGVIKGAWRAYSCIDRIDTFDGYMVLTCYRKKPTQDILLNVKGVGVNG